LSSTSGNQPEADVNLAFASSDAECALVGEKRRRAACVKPFGAVASTPALSRAPVLTFGLIGDLGYRLAEEPLLQNVFTLIVPITAVPGKAACEY